MTLEFRSVRYRYPRGNGYVPSAEILHDINLTVGSSEVLAIIGASGAGKTTLLRLMCGLATPTAGAIYHDGQRVSGPGRRRGIVFQHYGLFDWMTARANVEFAAARAGASGDALQQEADDLLASVGLLDHAGDYPRQLSGGMRQRLAIIRALAARPGILCLDEPFSALDPITKEEVRSMITAVSNRFGIALVIVSHDILTSVTTSDRCLVLSGEPATLTAEFTGFRGLYRGQATPDMLASETRDSGHHAMTAAPQLLVQFPWVVAALNSKEQRRAQAAIDVSEVVLQETHVRCHSHGGLRFFSDSADYSARDAVFPLHPESVLLSRMIPRRGEGRAFLDVGCGSGILPITAAARGWKASAIDVNPRALAYARASAAASGYELGLEQSDFRSFAPRDRFDFITVNLPFEPTAGLAINFLHSDGGGHGQELNLAMIKHLPNLLANHGVAVMYDVISLQRSDVSLLEDGLRAASDGMDVSLLRLSKPLPLSPLLARYGERAAEVEERLNADGFYSFFVETALFRSTISDATLEVVKAPIADLSWIYPVGEASMSFVVE